MKRKLSGLALLGAMLIMTGCSASQIMVTLDAITVAVDAGIAADPNVPVSVVAWAADIPAGLTCVTDIIQAGSALSKAQGCVTALQKIMLTPPAASSMSPQQALAVNAVIAAIASFITEYQAQISAASSTPAGAAFLASGKPYHASRADKKKAAEIAAKAKALKEKLAAKKKGII